MSCPRNQSKTGYIFESARLRLHLSLDRSDPLTREELAAMALEQFGPIQTALVCRRGVDPGPLARWKSKVRSLERRPGRRALADLRTRQLCTLLGIKILERECFELDLRDP